MLLFVALDFVVFVTTFSFLGVASAMHTDIDIILEESDQVRESLYVSIRPCIVMMRRIFITMLSV